MSVRTLTPALITLLGQDDLVMVLLLELLYSTPIRAASGTSNIDHFSQTFLATGMLGQVEPIRDTARELTGLRFALSGVPPEQIAQALTYSARNVPAKMWLAFSTVDARQTIVEAPLIFSGALDQMTINDDPSSNAATLAVTAIHMGKVFSRPRAYRYNESDQQRASPGDTSMRFMVSQANHKDVWPAASWGRR